MMPKTIATFTGDLQKLIAKFEPDKTRHDAMLALVERMLELNKRKLVAPPSRRQRSRQDAGATDLDREIASTDAEIDELVYELYGISEEERKVIEESL